jgi:hypothetical protein
MQNTKINEYIFFCRSFFTGILTCEHETTYVDSKCWDMIIEGHVVIFQKNGNPNAFSIFWYYNEIFQLKNTLIINRHQGGTTHANCKGGATYVNCTLQILLMKYWIQCRMLQLQPVYTGSGPTGVLK